MTILDSKMSNEELNNQNQQKLVEKLETMTLHIQSQLITIKEKRSVNNNGNTNRAPKEEPQEEPSSQPESITTPKVVVPNQGTSAVTPIDLTAFLESASSSQIRPTFLKYIPQNTTITKWKCLYLLKLTLCKSQYYQSFVTTDDSGLNIMNPNLSRDKKASLFSLIHDALPAATLNLEFITNSMIQSADGLQLWE
mmetsp:Transcript_11505/g.16261  ORF Transcript_11505/g.16261 Transcript_11505/m.16261 type:complete len:195 (-) Transcript_11505:963-1547(-)